jgi:predicted nucleotidyltransferase
MASSNFRAVLRALYDDGVKFVLVGGLAATFNGVMVDTLDVDIVPDRDEGNLTKLCGMLDSIDAIYRMQPARRLKPEVSHLTSTGHHNLITTLGPLDVLGTIGRGLSYQDLLPHTVEMDIGDGVRVRVLDLATIIAVKEELGSEKDLAVLPLLRRALKEKQGGG